MTSTHHKSYFSKKEVIYLNPSFSETITPLICSKLICQIIKYIVYQREQIPYSFDSLKYVVRRGRESQDTKKSGKYSHHEYTLACFDKQVTEAYGNLETIFQHIDDEFNKSECIDVEEVVLLLGATPYTPKETYTIVVPALALGHNESYHKPNKSFIQLLRCFVMSEKFCGLMSRSMSLTNLYILLKVRSERACNWLRPMVRFKMPTSGRQAVINLREAEKASPCPCIPTEPVKTHSSVDDLGASTFRIFQEDPRQVPSNAVPRTSTSNKEEQTANSVPTPCPSSQLTSSDHDVPCRSSEPEEYWYQALVTLKGFKNIKKRLNQSVH